MIKVIWGGEAFLKKKNQPKTTTQHNNFELNVKEKTLKGSKFKGTTCNIQIN